MDQRCRLFEVEIAHNPLPKIQFHASFGGASACLVEHRRRCVDAYDAPASPVRDWDGDATLPHRKLYEQPIGFPRELDVEGMSSVISAVPDRKLFRPAHQTMLMLEQVR